MYDAAAAEEWRALFAHDGQRLHMDAGAIGPPVHGIMDGDTPLCSTFADVRQAIAPGFGCDADEIVVTQSTTDALCKIIAGLRLRQGDEVLTTNHEHYGSLAPLAIARDRFGIVRKEIEVPVGDAQCAEEYVEAFDAAITPRTRVLLFSAPTATIGTMLPIRMLADLAQRRGCVSVVDAAHVPGMFHSSFHELGVDFLAGSGHKWQYGPPGTGLLYIRNKILPRYNPTPLPEFWPVVSVWYPLEGGLPARTTTGVASYDIAEYLQTVGGSASAARMDALRRVCAVWDRFGRGRIEAHLLALTRHLRERIAGQWGEDALYSPGRDARLLSAITAFNPFRRVVCHEAPALAFVERLHDRFGATVKHSKIKIKGSPAPQYAIRVAPRIYHSPDDVDAIVEAMKAVAEELDDAR